MYHERKKPVANIVRMVSEGDFRRYYTEQVSSLQLYLKGGCSIEFLRAPLGDCFYGLPGMSSA